MAEYKSVVIKAGSGGFDESLNYLLRLAIQKHCQEQYLRCLLGLASNCLPQTSQIMVSLRRRDLLAHSDEQYVWSSCFNVENSLPQIGHILV